MVDDLDIASRTYNAGTERTLDLARTAAQARANACRYAVAIFQHMGGRVAGKAIAATGAYLWRDTVDGEGRPLTPPKHVYEAVETVEPE